MNVGEKVVAVRAPGIEPGTKGTVIGHQGPNPIISWHLAGEVITTVLPSEVRRVAQ